MNQMIESHRSRVHVAIIGAGLSGLGMAIALRKDGIRDCVILERADDLGGTWRDNTYPGCACDIPSVLYSYAGERKADWSRVWAGQAEIWDYMREVARRHALESQIRYRHEVLAAGWDDDLQVWQIDTTEGGYSADVLIAAAGFLADPALPPLPGLDSFQGRAFHSARWDHQHELRGRRVAVIGTGASAIQFVPEIQPEVEHLSVFQRTPPWVLTRGNPPIPARWRRRFARHPALMRLFRGSVFSLQESLHLGFRHPAVMTLVEHRALADLARQVPDPALRAKLTPHYRLGCKRVLNSDRWYPALCAGNVDVITVGIAQVTPTGIVDAEGRRHELDTIIFGTGFRATDPPLGHRIHGRGGRLLWDCWQGSPKAHLGIGVAGFPNMFLLLGPNTGLGHNSALLMIEAQIAYLRQALRHLRQQGLGTLEPTAEAQARYVGRVDRDTRGSVWAAGGCHSWYFDATGRNSTLWPGSVRAYRRRLARFDAGDYAAELPRRLPEPRAAVA
jgi:cation diffusion facilitator CzcD-associated flavoprotein CzcO